MSVETATKGRTLGALAFAICLIEQAVFWGATAIQASTAPNAPPPHHWHYHAGPMMAILIAGLASIPIAIAGLILDSRRTLALMALVFGLVNMVVCALPFVA